MDGKSFLFSFSKLPDNATLEECIRQSQIEILSRHPLYDQVKNVFQYGLKALVQPQAENNSIDYQIIDLLISIYENYPDVLKIFNKNFQNHPNHIIFAFSIHKGDNYASNVLKNLLPQMREQNATDFYYLNYKISKATALFLCVNSLLLKTISNKIVSNFFECLIHSEYPFTASLLYKAKKDNSLNSVPDSLFNTICQFPNILSIVEVILPRFSKDVFLFNYDNIYKQIKKCSSKDEDKSKNGANKNSNENGKNHEIYQKEVSQVSKIMIQKIDEFQLNDKIDDISYLLEYYSGNQLFCFNFEDIVQIIKKYSDRVKLGPNFSNVYKDFKTDTISFLKLHPDPISVFPPASFVSFFTGYMKQENSAKNPDNLDWNKIFMSFFKEHPKINELRNPDFWMNFFELENIENEQISDAAKTYTVNFNGDSLFLDLLFKILLNGRITLSLAKFVCCLWDDDDNPATSFTQDCRIDHLMRRSHSNQSVSFPYYFWKIFPNVRFLINSVFDPFAVFGMSCILFDEDVSCSIPREISICICNQTEKSREVIRSFLETEFKSFQEMLEYFEKNPIGECKEAFNLISAALLFAASNLKFIIQSTSPSTESISNINYKNLQANLFPFLLIALKAIELKYGISMPVIRALTKTPCLAELPLKDNLFIDFPLDEFKLFLINSYLLFIFKHSRIFLTFEGMSEDLIKILSPLWTQIDLLNNTDPNIHEKVTIPLLELILIYPQRTANKVALTCIESNLPIFIPLILKNAVELNNSTINQDIEQPFKLHCQLLKFDKTLILNYFNDNYPVLDLNYAIFTVKICPLVLLLNFFSTKEVESKILPELYKAIEEKRDKDTKVLIKFIHFSNNDEILLNLLENKEQLKLDENVQRIIYMKLAEKNSSAILSNNNFVFNQIISRSENGVLRVKTVTFLLNLILDSDVRIDAYRMLFENQIENSFCIRAETLLSYFSDAYMKHPKELLTAINESYIGPIGDNAFLYKRVEKIPLHPIPDTIHQFIQKEFIENKDFEILKEIANQFPFIFKSFDSLFLLKEVCFVGFRSNQNIKNRQNAIMFLMFNAMNPEFLDEIIPFILEKLESNEFDEIDDKLMTLIFIESLLMTSSLQFVTTAILMKYNWNTIAYELLNQTNESKDELIAVKNEELKSFVVQISYLFMTIINKINDEEADVLDEIQKSENPFKEASGETICFPFINLNVIKKYFQIKSDNKDSPNFVFSRGISVKKKGNSSVNVEEYINSLIEGSVQIESKMNLPEGITKEFFDHLPVILQSSLLFQIVSSLTTKLNLNYDLNSLQKRFLFHQPLWVSQLIMTNQTFDLTRNLLPPEHYAILIPILKHLSELSTIRTVISEDGEEQIEVDDVEDIAKEDVTLLHYCQDDLIQYLLDDFMKSVDVNLIKKSYPSASDQIIQIQKQQKSLSFDLLIAFSNNLISYLAISDILNQFTSSKKSSINQAKLLKLLIVLSKSSEFVNVFSSFNEVLSALLSKLYETRQYARIISVLQIFVNMGENIPNQIIQYAVLLLFEGSNPNRVMLPTPLFKEVLKICSNLPTKKIDEISPYISEKFSRFLSKFNQKKHTNMLNLYLANFPFLITSNYNELIKILRDLLNRFHAENLPTICVLFDNLCPKRQPVPLIPLNQESESSGPSSNSNDNANNNASSGSRSVFSLFSSFFDNSSPGQSKSRKNRKGKKGNDDDDSKSRSNGRIVSVPRILYNQCPTFWEVVESHSKLIESLLEDHLFSELKFLTIYPEIIKFESRIDFFKKAQGKKLSSDNIHNIHEALMQAIESRNSVDRGFSFLQLLLGHISVFRVEVRRSNLLADSYRKLHSIQTEDWLKKFRISYIDEEGVDAGGLKKDWFSSLVKNLFNPNYALFVPSSNGRAYQPSPSSYVNPEHIEYFKFAGKILARALIEGVAVEAHMTRAFLKQILGQKESMSLTDIEDCDETLHQSFMWMLNNDVGPLEMYFTADFDDMGSHKLINLKEGGDQILVTNENKEEFIRLQVNHRLVQQISSQTNAFLDGFYSLIPLEEIRVFKPNELDLLICGVPDIDIEDFKNNVVFSSRSYNRNHKVIKMFFNIISRWSCQDLAKLLLFITGSSQVPYGGFKELASIGKPIVINHGGDSSRFPVAHTCTNTLDLPEYSNEAELEKKLIFSINECNSFGIA